MATRTAASSALSINMQLRALLLTTCLNLLIGFTCHAVKVDEKQVYLVYLDPSLATTKALAFTLLKKTAVSEPSSSLVHIYSHFNAFSVKLSGTEAVRLAQTEGVVYVLLDESPHLDDDVAALGPIPNDLVGPGPVAEDVEALTPDEGYDD